MKVVGIGLMVVVPGQGLYGQGVPPGIKGGFSGNGGNPMYMLGGIDLPQFRHFPQ